MPGRVASVHRVGYGVPFAAPLQGAPEPGLSARPSRPFRKPFDPQLLTAFPYLDSF